MQTHRHPHTQDTLLETIAQGFFFHSVVFRAVQRFFVLKIVIRTPFDYLALLVF